MIGIPLGLFAANATEWAFHKYVLHGLGKNKDSVWSFHFHEHHQAVRRNGHIDEDYRRSPFGNNAQGKELLALGGAAVLMLPLFPIAPFFTGTLVYCGVRYYVVHKRSHLDPEWAKENLPWHYDHHMGPDQDKNWGVTSCWMDHLMGTRVPYLGTAREQKDLDKAAKRKARAERKMAA